MDLVGDPELHAYLTNASPVRAGMLAAAAATLERIGVAEPARHAPGLVVLVDGLLFDRVAGSGVDPAARPDAEALIPGLPARPADMTRLRPAPVREAAGVLAAALSRGRRSAAGAAPGSGPG